jgi:hypothetical protein
MKIVQSNWYNSQEILQRASTTRVGGEDGVEVQAQVSGELSADRPAEQRSRKWDDDDTNEPRFKDVDTAPPMLSSQAENPEIDSSGCWR